MTPVPRIGWFGRTFGWSGSQSQWLTLLGVMAWLAGFIFLGFKSLNWSIGQTLLALSVWCFVLGLAARDAVRDLFGPVFFYDLLRVSRNRTTFVLRGLYVVGIGMLLALMYYSWLLNNGQRDDRTKGELALASAAVLGIVAFLFHKASRGQFATGFRLLFLLLCTVLGLILLITAISFLASDDPYSNSVRALIPPTRLSRFANEFFEIYVGIQFGVAVLLTPVYVAGTIAVEKERKTLEFLFATDLRNREIIFGKLAARVLTLIMYVLAGLPLLAFLQLFGGIDPEQLLAAVTATVTMVIGLSALSIWVSTNLKRARDAIVLTYLIAVTYGFVSFMLAGLANAPFGAGWWNTPITLLGYSAGVNDVIAFLADGNPAWALMKLSSRGAFAALSSGLGPVLREFVVFWLLATIILLGTSISRLRRVALAQAYGPVQKRNLFIHPKAKTDDPRQERRASISSRPPIGDNPVTWKEVFVDSTYRGGCIGRLVGGVILALILVPFLIITYFEFFDNWRLTRGGYSSGEQWNRYQEEINGWVRITTGVLGTLLFISAAMRGASAISGEKDKDTWISLIGTPMSAEEILIGKWWGCVLSLRRAMFVMVIVWGVGLALGAINPIMLPVMLMLTAVYVSAFSWVGLYFSLTARNTMIASVRAFFGALFCAGGFWAVVGLCCFMPMGILNVRGDTPELFGTFMLGWTPPLVYGVFPLRLLEADELGPFDTDRSRSAGLLGPIIGTVFWIVFSLLLKLHCETIMRRITNRDPQERTPTPREKTTSLAQT